jgi:hypothetical protein
LGNVNAPILPQMGGAGKVVIAPCFRAIHLRTPGPQNAPASYWLVGRLAYAA